MVRSLAGRVFIHTLYAMCLLAEFATLLHAEPATVWTYKDSVVALSQSGSSVIITYQTLSEALVKAGANRGDPLFRGRRIGNSLSGKVYRFFGGQCQPMGFGVEGTIEEDRIVLQGIAPSLGLNSCNVVTTFYDTVLLTAVSAPGEPRQATITPAETNAVQGNFSRCQTGDKQACAAVLASPLLTEETRAEVEAAAALPVAPPTPVYLLLPFLCTIENGKPILTPSKEPYYHEALDYRPSSDYAVCSSDKGGWVQSPLTTCRVLGLTSLRLVCKDGIATAPDLTPANKSQFAKASRVDGDSVLVPLFNRFRSADVPESFHRLPAGWGIFPPPNAVMSARSFEAFGSKHIPVTGNPATALPDSFFLTLADWSPLPQIVALSILIIAAGFAAFGFSHYPDSLLSPRRPIFWISLAITTLGLVSALSAGDAIKEAFDQGQREVAAIARDQAQLQSLFPKRGGHVEPFRSRDLDLATNLQRPRTIIDPVAVARDVPSRVFFYLLPTCIFLVAYARFVFAGYHYLFVRHPAEEIAAPALRTGELFDQQKLVDALGGDPQDLVDHPPLHRTQNLLHRAQVLREKIEADADIAEAAMRRDRARAAQAEAEDDLRKARKKLPWWQRLLSR
jgi:hypothetical protein